MDPILLIGVLILFALLLAGSIAGIVISVRRNARRTEQWLRLAPGLSLTPIQPEELIRRQGPGEAAVWDAAGDAFGLARGNRGQVTNLFHGERDGRDVWLFDFCYSRSPGPPGGSLRATVVSLALHDPLPRFKLSPEGLMDRLIDATGGSDIDFPTNATFSRLYALQGEDEAAVRALFSEPVLDYFGGRSGCSVASVGGRLVCHSVATTDGRVPVSDIASLLGQAVEVARQLRA